MTALPTHRHDLRPFAHPHRFDDAGRQARERALLAVTLLTLATMLLELVAGWWTGSLALTADGWHMGTHALALGGAVLAYRFSRRAEGSARFAFGGWKIEVLAGYTSALALLGVALWLAWEGVQTLRAPRAVDYTEALVVAVLGLAVNVASVWMLSGRGHPGQGHDHHGHDHGHDHNHDHHRHDHHHHHHHHHHGHGHDHNFRAAYAHVLADALTSLLAIAALAGGAWWGLAWLDPAVALLGAVLIGHWSWGLLRQTGGALVDATHDATLDAAIRAALQADGDAQVADLHLWQVGTRSWCAALTVVADVPRPAAEYRARLAALPALGHVTVEVHRCPAAPAP